MTFLVVGVSHHETPLELRERLSFPLDDLSIALQRLRSFAHEGVILSTCNRTEIYADVGHPKSGAEALVRFLAESRSVDADELARTTFSYCQLDAVRHLFRVSAEIGRAHV